MYLEPLVEHHPSHLGGHCQLATCHMQLGNKVLAREMFTEVLVKNPNHTTALRNYGEL